MRILMISDVYFPRINGVSTSIQTFATEFSKQGHQVTLIAPDYGPMAPGRSWALRKGTSISAAPPHAEHTGDELESFEIIRIASRYLPLDTEDRLLRMSRIRSLTPRLAAQDYDLLHIQTPFIAHYAGLKLVRRLKVPVVESYHTFFEQYVDKYITCLPPSWLRLAARHISAAQCGNLDALVVPSRATRSILETYGVTTPATVIPTGIELEQFSQGDGARFRHRYGIPADRPVLVHIGRLAFEKNVDFLLRMLVRVKREIPEVLLVIAGEGPARRRLESMGVELGLREQLLFVGYLSRDGDLEDCYRAGDGFVFASRTETQGLVLLEAMALGVPVVSTAVMGTQEVLDGGEGCLIAADDEADFASKTVRLLSDSNLRTRLGAQARAYARTWSAPVLADRMLAFYRTLVSR
ncbi:glycosyltransferase [Candidatus Thiosymbion oneisti]|uniref:glycosyltransferase n=1 Tax=Candidatus Thiosymbion oneisti TaxID=589554 RepID=UPI000B252552|nr:glycosyltransferase [Candidatus Thiosymbion oneisti]